MLLLLSPAKSLDYHSPAEGVPHTLPQFVSQSEELIEVLKHKTPAQISELMDLSDNLAALNVARYEAWRPKFSDKNSKQAVLAFNGDVYDGLDAKSLKPKDLEWAQDHLCILSGLYGVLRPLDWMQPYRLEMGTALTNPRGKNLYQFWGASIAHHFNEQLAKEKAPVVINLASQEYFKVVDQKVLKARVVECVFEEYKGGKYKVISFFAKRARGLLARYAIQKHIQIPEKLKDFNLEGYAYAASESDVNRWVFRRREKGAV
ncbi:MAG: peroxide stress protein YaaA [Limnohabitans sp.]|nr:peroxide stress protein YaaA [Limnohabitans sp.]